jgi:hypothetical protein
MSTRAADPASIGVGVGLVLGAGLGTVVGTLFALPLGAVIGYGVGTGLIIGAAAGRLAIANRGESHVALRLVGGAMLLGAIAGGPVGLLATWVHGGSALWGLLVGILAGLAHGLLVGGVLLAAVGGNAAA